MFGIDPESPKQGQIALFKYLLSGEGELAREIPSRICTHFLCICSPTTFRLLRSLSSALFLLRSSITLSETLHLNSNQHLFPPKKSICILLTQHYFLLRLLLLQTQKPPLWGSVSYAGSLPGEPVSFTKVNHKRADLSTDSSDSVRTCPRVAQGSGLSVLF